jgi:hypothetical protein
MDAVWLVSASAAMLPVWGWVVAHNVGTPPMTVQLFSAVHRYGGGWGFIALPGLSVAFGLVYLTGVTKMTKRVRVALAAREEQR